MIDHRHAERPKWRPTNAHKTIMMLTRCFEAQYRSLQPELRALLSEHDADLPFITNPTPTGIRARLTALWWTDDLTVPREHRIFMMVKEDVFF